MCIRNRENVSYIHYIYDLNCVYQKGGNVWYIQYNYIIPEKGETILYLYDLVLCVSERKKLYYIYSVFMIQTLCIKKRETVSYLQCVYDPEFVYQKYANCIIPTVCLIFRLCASERRNLYHSNMIRTFWQWTIKSNSIPIWVVEMEEIVSCMKLVIWVEGFVC